jgi:C-terminal processing protease CtpA/Prc
MKSHIVYIKLALRARFVNLFLDLGGRVYRLGQHFLDTRSGGCAAVSLLEITFLKFANFYQTFRKKPVAVLVDEGSASTSEILAQGLQDLGVARIFGRTTAGAALPSMIVRLPCGDLLQYAIAGYHSRSGKRLEGAGVLPDEVIPVDPGKIRDEGDPILNAALRWFEGSTGVREETSR